MTPAANSQRLAATFKTYGSDVGHRSLPAGHGLSQADIALTKEWLPRL